VKMCGILGVAINKYNYGTIKTLYNIFINQKSRGLQGAGISIRNSDGLFRFRSVSPFRIFNAYNFNIWARIKKGSCVSLHHRYPTSSDNEPKFNHPISNEDGSVHVIHNGILMNEDKLYNEMKASHTFETKVKDSKKFTDSEVVVHIFEDVYKGKEENIVDAMKAVYEKVEGSFALVFTLKDVDGLFLLKHTMPIIISKDKYNNHYFSSEFEKDNGLTKLKTMAEGEVGVLKSDGYTKLAKFGKHKDDMKVKWKKGKHKWVYDSPDNFGFVNYGLNWMKPTNWDY